MIVEGVELRVCAFFFDLAQALGLQGERRSYSLGESPVRKSVAPPRREASNEQAVARLRLTDKDGGSPRPWASVSLTAHYHHNTEAIIERYCPTEAEVNTGAVIVIRCLNRLVAPRPLSGVADWAAKTAIEELTGVPASKLNDDRLGRALDAIYPHLEEIWVEIVGRALLRYDIDLSLVFYDLTAFYSEGAYRQNQAIILGHSRAHRLPAQAGASG